MTADNLDYFQQRAEAELELARTADHANAVRAHYTLAGYYLDLVHNAEAQAALSAASAEMPSGGLDQWAIRYASKASRQHGELAPEHVLSRIDACRSAGDGAGVRLWQQVLNLVERDPAGRALTAG